MVTRTWNCLNRHCRKQFDSEVDNPPCIKCGGAYTKWQPRPFGIVSEKTRGATRDAEKLAQDFRMTNYRSPEAGLHAKLPTPTSAAMARAGAIQGAIDARNAVHYSAPGMPGWQAQIPVDPHTGRMVPACLTTGVTAKLSGKHLSDGPQPKSKTLGAGSQIAHVPHRPAGGVPR